MRSNTHSPVRDRRQRGCLLHSGDRVGLAKHRHVAVTTLPLIRTAHQASGLTGQLNARLLTETEGAHHGVAVFIAHRLTDQDGASV